MKQKQKKKFNIKLKSIKYKLLCAVLSAYTVLASCVFPVFSVDNTGKDNANIIEIRDASDFDTFRAVCETDDNAQKITVYLINDIDLSGTDFSPVPTFGGNFDGGGHRISGVKIYGKGSHLGLFRYIQDGASVKNLSVYGDISPDGSAEYIGGIAGENRGTVSNCSFSGKVFGKTSVGGICGYVSESGKISDCSFRGKVCGKTYTGGICGQNFGIIENCENRGAINTVTVDEKPDIENIETDISNVRSSENIAANTDTGGICGYTKGSVVGCRNYGSVGDRSVGYNTGGICGRQAGYINDCENHGVINGRKDIGGIAGQAEPYVLIEFAEDVLSKLKAKLSDIRKAADSLNSPDDDIHNGISAVTDAISVIGDNTETIADSMTEYADSIVESINDAADRLHTALEDSTDIFDSVSSAIAEIADGLSSFSESGGYIEEAFLCIENALNQASQAETPLTEAANSLKSASDKISEASEDFKNSISSLDGGAYELRRALRALSNALKEKQDIESNFENIRRNIELIRQSFESAGGSLEEIAAALKEVHDKGYIGDSISGTIDNLEKSAKCLKKIADAAEKICGALITLSEDFDAYSLTSAFGQLSLGFSSLSDAFDSFEQTVSVFTPALNELGLSSESAQKAAEQATDGIEHLETGARCVKNAVDNMNSIIETVTAPGAVKFPEISDDFRANLDGFFDSVDTMQEKISSLSDTVRTKKYNASDKLDNLSSEIGALTDILSNAYDEYIDSSEKDAIEDISDNDNAENTKDKNGKISSSRNFGEVFGDINAGGIVGSIAVEYDFDPEDDITDSGKRSLKYTFKTKCVVHGCTNSGSVAGKRNYVGGIVGRMDMGSVVLCDSYGTVNAPNGRYVGGVAGKSDAVIRNSVAKCIVYGKDYVGGIAGEAKTVSNCRALVNIAEYSEFAGEIAGAAQPENLQSNFFVSCAKKIGAVDGINYRGAAEECDIASFEAFMQSVLGKQAVFTLTFCADGKTVAKVPYVYNKPIPKEQIPSIPRKDGYFGKWSEYDFEAPQFDAVITAEYQRNNTILQSSESRSDGKPAVIICGSFDDTAKVVLSESLNAVSSVKNIVEATEVFIECRNTENEKYKVRYLPSSEMSVDIYVVCDNKIEKVKPQKIGSYLEFETPQQSFEIIEAKKSYPTAAIIIIAVCAAAAATVIILAAKKKKSKKKSK